MKEILLSACGAWVLVNMIEWHLLFRINRKPFNCHTCLAGWFCLVLNIGHYWLEVPFLMAASMMVAALFNSIMRKI